jgi:hypothetical protein
MQLLWSLGLGAWIFGANVAHADNVTLTPSADTTLHENFPENNLGAQAYFNAGTTQNGPRTRGLMAFDVAGAVPSGAIINSVTLTLEVVGQPVDGDAPSNFGVHRMLVGWGEGTGSGNPPLLGRPALPDEANWNFRFSSSTPWTLPGGLAGVDFASQISSDTFIYGVNFSPYSFDTTQRLIDDVQLWLDQPGQNFGWMLLSQAENEVFSARRFGSREDPFRAPQLMIDFTPVPEPRVWAFSLLASGVWWWGRRMRYRNQLRHQATICNPGDLVRRMRRSLEGREHPLSCTYFDEASVIPWASATALLERLPAHDVDAAKERGLDQWRRL